MSVPGRVADYDSVAEKYDRRYDLHAYAGVRESLLEFLDLGSITAVLEVGCGTGHWLREIEAEQLLVAGVEPSSEMIERAHTAVPSAHLVRGKAEALPCRDASFDRVVCINALHHFVDRLGFFAEARRVLKPGGALMSIGKDPHGERDAWWVYDYFPETVAIDRERFAPVRILRGELAAAGFAWAESLEVDRIEAVTSANEALASGVVDRAYTSQLTVLTNEEFESGVARIKDANAAAGGQLDLVTDFRLFATIGRLS